MLKFLSYMLCTQKRHPFSLAEYLKIEPIFENLMIIRVTSVEWTWFGLKWPLLPSILPCTRVI